VTGQNYRDKSQHPSVNKRRSLHCIGGTNYNAVKRAAVGPQNTYNAFLCARETSVAQSSADMEIATCYSPRFSRIQLFSTRDFKSVQETITNTAVRRQNVRLQKLM